MDSVEALGVQHRPHRDDTVAEKTMETPQSRDGLWVCPVGSLGRVQAHITDWETAPQSSCARAGMKAGLCPDSVSGSLGEPGAPAEGLRVS